LNCRLRNNTVGDANAALATGGAIRHQAGLLCVLDSSLSDNHVQASTDSGGIAQAGALFVDLNASAKIARGAGGSNTISAQLASGAGINNEGILAITNSTITGNGMSAFTFAGGGGVFCFGAGGSVIIRSCTIASNVAGTSGGGGLGTFGNGSMNIQNTIV